MLRAFNYHRTGMIFAAIVGGFILGASSAAAGDLAGAEDLLANAEDLLANAPEIDETRGWYLRGDIGYVANEKPDWSTLRGEAGPQHLDDSWLAGVGVGLHLNDWLRVDATADYRFKAGYSVQGLSADYTAAAFMANAYVDLITWNGITPYLGAGLGASYAGFSNAALNGASLGDARGWGFAWGLMGGFAIELAPNWMVDIGYRYLALDSVDPGRGAPDFDQSAHEVRIGFRYMFD